MIYSFEIFDTCLIRRCGKAENVFWLLGQRLFGTDSTEAEMFYHWRCSAEDNASKKNKRKTVTISEIYSTLPPEVQGCYEIEYLIHSEMQVESEMLRAIPSTLEIIRSLRKKDGRIIYISDMYLPSIWIKEVLQREGFYQEGDSIFISCEDGETKHAGLLYQHVSQMLGNQIDYHYGDNSWSDFKMAKKSGIIPVLVHTEFNKTEQRLLKQTAHVKYAQALSCLIGALRYSRLTDPCQLQADMSADFVAPIFVAYVLDILRKAEREHIQRLYFLARDGYILLWIAEQLISQFPEVDIRYLYVSRKSLFLPSLTSTNHEEIEKYFGDGLRYTSQEQINNYFKQDAGWNDTVVLEKAKETRQRINQYFVQAGVYDQNVKYALVDVGWKGSGRYAFNKLLQMKACPEREVWYWGTFSSWRNKFPGKFYTYNMNQDLPLHFITLIEDYFSTSPDLSTIDYDDGKPVFDETSRIDNHEILEMNKYCLKHYIDFVSQYHLDGSCFHNQLSYLACDVLIQHPEYINLNTLTKMKAFSEHGNNHNSFIKKVGISYTFKYCMGKNGLSGWTDGNISYTHPRMFNLMRSCRRVFQTLRIFLNKNHSSE